MLYIVNKMWYTLLAIFRRYAVYLNKIPSKSTGRVFLTIVESYKERGKSRQRLIQSIGYLDELENEYDDPIAHFKALAKQMTFEKKQQQAEVTITFKPFADTLSVDPTEPNRKNIGYLALSSVYHALKIDYFLNNRRRCTKAEFNHNAIFKLLVFDRVLFPSSKRGAWFHKDRFFERMDFSLDDVYRALPLFTKYKDQFLSALHTSITKLYGRETSLVYYDVTNYYFEIDKEDELRKKGVSKEHRPDPIVQMGLFTDEKGIPISYGLFPGNTNDSITLPSMMGDLSYELDIDKMIIVADKGMMSGKNVARIRAEKNGYVISYSVRGASKEFQDYVLEDEGYIAWTDEAKYKSRFQPRTIAYTNTKGEKEELTINERCIVFYSKKYADKAKRDRAKAVEKARKIAENPKLRAKMKLKGAAKYLDTLHYDQEGEIINTAKDDVVFDEAKLAEEEKLDGYYVIMTNVIGIGPEEKPFKQKSRYTKDGFFQLNRRVSDTDVIDMYKRLWKIEESFRVTKSTLQARPVFLSREDHIEAHFLVCFTALTIMRILEHLSEGAYGADRIAKSLRQASGSCLENGYYLFDYYDEVLRDLGSASNLDFSRKYLTNGEIRSMAAATKKTD